MAGRVFWSVCGILISILAFVLWYAYPHWLTEMRPTGSITMNAIPELVSLIIEVGVLAGLIGLLQNREWHGARRTVHWHINQDARKLAVIIEEFDENWDNERRRPRTRFATTHFRNLTEWSKSRDLHNRFNFLASGFTPELAETVANYFDAKDSLHSCLVDLDAKTFGALVFSVNDDNDSAAQLIRQFKPDQLFNARYACEHLDTILKHTLDRLKLDESEKGLAEEVAETADRVALSHVLVEAVSLTETEAFADT